MQHINNSNHSRTSNLDDIFDSEDNIKGGGVRRKSGLDLSVILEPPDNISSNTVVDQGMEFNNLLGSNPPRQLSSPNPGTTLPPPPAPTLDYQVNTEQDLMSILKELNLGLGEINYSCLYRFLD